MTRKKGKDWTKIVLVAGLGLLASGVLFVSLARASLEMTLLCEEEGRWRKELVEFVKENREGEKERGVYKLPGVRTLPGSIWYPLKSLRDHTWIGLCQDEAEKAKLQLLLADKKISEAKLLFSKGQGDRALKSAEKAIQELKAAELSLEESKISKKVKIKLRGQLREAGLVYGEILQNAAEGADIDKQNELLIQIWRWNEKQKEKINQEK